MKLINKVTISVVAVASIFLTGCENQPAQVDVSQKIDETNLGYRSAKLDDEKNINIPKAEYSKAEPGSGKKIKRSFQDAPPLIPHSVNGMLPITQNNNQCITCHVDSAPYDKTIPSVPVSHKTNFRPKSYAIKGINTSGLDKIAIKKENRLIPARFNCSQCHVPQANLEPIVANKFSPEYKTKDGAFKSSWDDTKFMEGIDTTK